MKLGIDLGGTKIEIIALDDQGGELLRRRVPTTQGDYSGTLRAIADLVHRAEAALGQAGALDGCASMNVVIPRRQPAGRRPIRR